MASARRRINAWSEAVLEHRPQGPLGKRLVDNCPMGQDLPKVRRDATNTFGFAGHDTTYVLPQEALLRVLRGCLSMN